MKIHKKLENFQYNIFLFYLPQFFFSSSAYASRVQSKQSLLGICKREVMQEKDVDNSYCTSCIHFQSILERLSLGLLHYLR